MTDHPDAELLRLGNDMERLLKADALLSDAETYNTRTAVSSQTVRVMKAIHRLKPTTIEGIAVKLRAICFDLADFSEEDADLRNGDVAEVQLGRLMKHVQKLARAQG